MLRTLASTTSALALIMLLGACSDSTSPDGDGDGADACAGDAPICFDYLPEQALALTRAGGLSEEQHTVVQADIDGDGRQDLVFNERNNNPSHNRVQVAFASAAGTFSVAPHDDSPAGSAVAWLEFTLLAADVNGDGRSDLVWNRLTAANNITYAALSNGDGTFDWRPLQERAGVGWNLYTVATGDLNGDGRADLVWTSREPMRTRTYFGISQADGSFAIDAFADQSGDFSNYRPARVGSFNGDAYADIVLNSNGSANHTFVGLFTPTSATSGTLDWEVHVRPEGGWAPYEWALGDIDGQNGTDLIWVRSRDSDASAVVHRSFSDGLGGFTIPATEPTHQAAPIAGPAEHYVADFDNDGRDDLLLNRMSGSNLNELLVGLGTSSGSFTFPAAPEPHEVQPTLGWSLYDEVFVGDVNGDGKADILWTDDVDPRVYVALTR